MKDSMKKVVDASRKTGKQAGILLKKTEQIETAVNDGFTFIAVGTDLGIVRNGLTDIVRGFDGLK